MQISVFQLGGICVGRETDAVGYLHSFTVGTDTHLVSCSALSSDGEPNDVYHTVTRSLPGGKLLLQLGLMYFINYMTLHNRARSNLISN